MADKETLGAFREIYLAHLKELRKNRILRKEKSLVTKTQARSLHGIQGFIHV